MMFKWIAFAALLMATAAHAEDCKAIQDAAARLACFDKAPKAAPSAKRSAAASDPEMEKAKRAILATRGRLFKDADSLRDVAIGKPFTCLSGSGTCVCIEANGKTSAGGYSGVQLLGIKILSATETDMIGEMAVSPGEPPCGKLTPFPQMNGRAAR